MGRLKKSQAKTVRATGGVSIVKRGGKYYLRFRDTDGIRRMQLAGTTLIAAQAAAQTETKDLVRKKDAQLAGKSLGATPVPFGEFALEYLGVLRATMRPATLKVIGTQIVAFDKFLQSRGNPTLDKITRAHADAYLAAESARGCASAYLSRQSWALGRLWRGALERGLATENPFARRKFSRQSTLEVRYLLPEQLDAILALIKPRHRDIVTLLADTGLRIGEAIGLSWADVELDGPNPTMSVTRQGPERALLKTVAARRTIPLLYVPRALEILKRRKSASVTGVERVFPENGTSYNILLSLHAACDEAKQPRIRLHDLRHQFASHLVRARVPFPTVARLLGHADGGALVAKRYGRWQPQDAEALAMRDLMGFRTPLASAAK